MVTFIVNKDALYGPDTIRVSEFKVLAGLAMWRVLIMDKPRSGEVSFLKT